MATIGSAGHGGSLLKILVMESFEGSNMLLSLPTIQLENGGYTWGRPESTGSVNDMLACRRMG